MSDKATYQAIFFGPNVIAAGTPRELEYVDGKYQQEVVLQIEEDGVTTRRRFKIGRVTDEPIAYRFDEDVHDEKGEADVPN
ncbi:hypothetical protein E3T26_02255 [Cryobacterium sp. TMT1-21]|uniref:Uncharacterized protein n=1 Tax=Cryobacterium shii TaxID=1259235 RepID=A0AAQ2C5W8_9MICO|nr:MULTISPECIES: hypothetical protein [Cryobacterium]TFC46405.1 hypothetical protein E3O49_09840 [Cryobacterium shii]TFC80744.1 hypothetical protein E3T24_16510 [Cryobacterium sp. TmT2-59]TFD17327.1 hypothetical protein E3T26_02255 [Cryobacterium sp. TMT1-21]TFD20347.1 hypothetical protein E3T32_09130 [Cryobacterium sp. TMT2-23]TFD22348.1 hypothetical protein E3T42_00020 [Cryobacterium sp. TMT4-10]